MSLSVIILLSNMVKRTGLSFEISTVIFVLVSLTNTKGDVTRVSAIEGEEIELDFSYPSECARVTLRNGMRAPFYDSTNQDSLSLSENQELEFRNETGSNNCLLQLKINPVLRSDEGGYILTAYSDDGNIVEDTRVGLRVDYPPGKASCGWGKENVGDDWGSLECTAPSGSLLGEIICYQNGERVPPMGGPRDSVDSLVQTMWVRYSQPAFCCALVVGQPIDRCQCTDYTWDPHSITTEPCPVDMVTTHQEASNSSQSPTSIPTNEETQNTTKNHWSKYVVLHVIYLCVIGILVIIIIGLCIALKMSYRKVYQVKKNAKITHSQPYHEHMKYKSVGTAEM